MAKDMTSKESAETILEKIGHKRRTAEDLWNDVQPQALPPDTSMLSKALRTYCLRIEPSWNKRQFEENVAGVLDKCLSLLDSVRSTEDSDKWLKVSKIVMARTLGVEGK
jgi:hypothetical protein